MRKLFGLSAAAALLASASLIGGFGGGHALADSCTAGSASGNVCQIGASVTLSQGVLTLAAPALNAFPGFTLDGKDHTGLAGTWAGTFTVTDATGTGNGWHITLGAAPFTCAGNAGCQNNDTFPYNEMTGGAFSGYTCGAYAQQHCPSGLSGTGNAAGPANSSKNSTAGAPIDNNANSGALAPVEEVTAAQYTGMGQYNVSLSSLSLTVPADAYASKYTTTIYATLASNP